MSPHAQKTNSSATARMMMNVFFMMISFDAKNIDLLLYHNKTIKYNVASIRGAARFLLDRLRSFTLSLFKEPCCAVSGFKSVPFQGIIEWRKMRK